MTSVWFTSRPCIQVFEMCHRASSAQGGQIVGLPPDPKMHRCPCYLYPELHSKGLEVCEPAKLLPTQRSSLPAVPQADGQRDQTCEGGANVAQRHGRGGHEWRLVQHRHVEYHEFGQPGCMVTAMCQDRQCAKIRKFCQQQHTSEPPGLPRRQLDEGKHSSQVADINI